MSFDLSTQDYSKSADIGFTFDLLLPEGKVSGAKFTVIGEMSSVVTSFGKQQYLSLKARMKAVEKQGKVWEPSLEDAEDADIDNALIRLVGWEGITEGGKEVKFTKDKARDMLTKHDWMRKQIIEESRNVANFTPKA